MAKNTGKFTLAYSSPLFKSLLIKKYEINTNTLSTYNTMYAETNFILNPNNLNFYVSIFKKSNS